MTRTLIISSTRYLKSRHGALHLVLTLALAVQLLPFSSFAQEPSLPRVRPPRADARNQQLAKFETRCGWYDNPTPGNHWLSDRDDEWIIGVQGGYQLEDFVAPVFKKTQWVSYFGRSYGYGCACFRMRVDKETKHVLEIKSSSARQLSVCRKDKALRKWKVEGN